MSGFLAYQVPGEEKVIQRGEWVKVSMEELPADRFFITDFQKENCFYFNASNESVEVYDFQSDHKDLSDIFVVNGNAYLNGLAIFIDEFEPREIKKAVYSRINVVEKMSRTSPIDLFHNITNKYSDDALVYLVSDSQFGTWMGATPEILLRGEASNISSMALAGTKASLSDEWTEKEYHEQQLVESFIEQTIRAQHPIDFEKSELKTVKNGAVYHLRTDFSFQLPEPKWNALIDELHPTPAVCGTPRENALELINSFEPHDRDFYAGLVGIKGADRLNVYVNLRCMQVMIEHYALYVGGGITNDSDIADEWNETEEKSQTLLSVINSSADPS
jgi:isochorismate synthase